jgi:hypothetical protein
MYELVWQSHHQGTLHLCRHGNQNDNEVKVTAYAFDKFAGFHHMSDGTEWTFTAEKSRDKNRPVMQNLMERFPIILHLLKL